MKKLTAVNINLERLKSVQSSTSLHLMDKMIYEQNTLTDLLRDVLCTNIMEMKSKEKGDSQEKQTSELQMKSTYVQKTHW